MRPGRITPSRKRAAKRFTIRRDFFSSFIELDTWLLELTPATLVSKHKNCMVTPCMNPINPDIPLMPVAETGSITETERDGLVALNA